MIVPLAVNTTDAEPVTNIHTVLLPTHDHHTLNMQIRFFHTNFHTNSFNDALAIPIKTNAKNNLPQPPCCKCTFRNKFALKKDA